MYVMQCGGADRRGAGGNEAAGAVGQIVASDLSIWGLFWSAHLVVKL